MVALNRVLSRFDPSNAVPLIRQQWDMLSRLPGGKTLFSRFVGLLAPYTGSMNAQVEEIRRGYARVSLQERRSIRNHLKSVHAIALANLVELTGNLALLYSAPDDARMIVRGLSVEYLKKARGLLVAECECPIPESAERREYPLEVLIRDASGEVVAKGTLTSLLGPARKD